MAVHLGLKHHGPQPSLERGAAAKVGDLPRPAFGAVQFCDHLVGQVALPGQVHQELPVVPMELLPGRLDAAGAGRGQGEVLETQAEDEFAQSATLCLRSIALDRTLERQGEIRFREPIALDAG